MRYPAVAVDHVRCPALLLHGLQDAASEEYRTLVVVGEEVALSIAEDTLAVELVLIVDVVYLHPGSC